MVVEEGKGEEERGGSGGGVGRVRLAVWLLLPACVTGRSFPLTKKAELRRRGVRAGGAVPALTPHPLHTQDYERRSDSPHLTPTNTTNQGKCTRRHGSRSHCWRGWAEIYRGTLPV